LREFHKPLPLLGRFRNRTSPAFANAQESCLWNDTRENQKTGRYQCRPADPLPAVNGNALASRQELGQLFHEFQSSFS